MKPMPWPSRNPVPVFSTQAGTLSATMTFRLHKNDEFQNKGQFPGNAHAL
jgi:hypothetical protein